MSSPARGTPGNPRGAVRLRYGITPINQGAVPPFPELLPLEDALVPSAQALSDRADDGDQLDKYLLYRA